MVGETPREDEDIIFESDTKGFKLNELKNMLAKPNLSDDERKTLETELERRPDEEFERRVEDMGVKELREELRNYHYGRKEKIEK